MHDPGESSDPGPTRWPPSPQQQLLSSRTRLPVSRPSGPSLNVPSPRDQPLLPIVNNSEDEGDFLWWVAPNLALEDDEKATTSSRLLDDHDVISPLGLSQFKGEAPEPEYSIKTRTDLGFLDDGYEWRKDVVLSSPFSRDYYCCTTAGCPVTKRAERPAEDPGLMITTYRGIHTHPRPRALDFPHPSSNWQGFPPRKKSVEVSQILDQPEWGVIEPIQKFIQDGPIDDMSAESTIPGGVDETCMLWHDDKKAAATTSSGDDHVVSSPSDPSPGSFSKRKTLVRLKRRRKGTLGLFSRGPPISTPTTVTECISNSDDGYKWRKYGQKSVKNSRYPRNYYRCTTPKCPVRKRTERFTEDPNLLITTYGNTHTHTHPMPMALDHPSGSMLRDLNLHEETECVTAPQVHMHLPESQLSSFVRHPAEKAQGNPVPDHYGGKQTVQHMSSLPHDVEVKHKIFISHSGAQKGFAEQLCVDLEELGFMCPFINQRQLSLPKGKDFGPLIKEAARRCVVAVFVLSEQFLRSKWPMVELAEFHGAQEAGNQRLNMLPLFYMLSVKDLDERAIEECWMPEWRQLAHSDERIDVEKWSSAVRALRKVNGVVFGQKGASEVAYRDEIIQSIFQLLPSDLVYGSSCEMVDYSQPSYQDNEELELSKAEGQGTMVENSMPFEENINDISNDIM